VTTSEADRPSTSQRHLVGSLDASRPLELSAVPASPTAGEPVQLSVLNAPTAVTDYRWKLAGHRTRPLRLPSTPRLTLRFPTPGIQRVTVLITSQGLAHRAELTLRIRSNPPTAAPPGSPAPQQSEPPKPNRTPPLELSAVPANPTADEPVQLSVLNAPSAVTDYRWKLAGHRTRPLRLPSTPRVTLRFETPGTERVTVLITDQGLAHQAELTLRVRPHPPTKALHADPTRPRPEQSIRHEPRAHAATDPGVTISDFKFTASTVTVHAGQTITWTNDGPSSHTATAKDGSFNTGVLKKGASASHTFPQPGTYTYFCQIHPFMHGTVIVLPAVTTPAASHTPSPATTQPSGATTTTPTQTVPASSGATLPFTGLNVIAVAVFGFLLIGLGLTLRRGLSSR
jgi:plastocyanin